MTKKSFKETTKATVAANKWVALFFGVLTVSGGIAAFVQATRLPGMGLLYALGGMFFLIGVWLLWGFILNSKR